jgi:hypothetical protein
VQYIATLLASITAVVAVLIAYRQLRSDRRAAHGQLAQAVLANLYSRRFREARSIVYGLYQRPLDEWSNEEYLAAEEVGRCFGEVGFLLRNGYLVNDELVTWWGQTIIVLYQIALPMITARRNSEGIETQFIYFEWLARWAYHRSRKAAWYETKEWKSFKSRTQGVYDYIPIKSVRRQLDIMTTMSGGQSGERICPKLGLREALSKTQLVRPASYAMLAAAAAWPLIRWARHR